MSTGTNTIFGIFDVDAGGRGATSMEFTTITEARACAIAYLETPSAYRVWLWTGTAWEVYT